MKKLRKVKTTLRDSIEAYAGACDCAPNCNCNRCACTCYDALKLANDWDSAEKHPTAPNQEFVGVSTSLSSVHY